MRTTYYLLETGTTRSISRINTKVDEHPVGSNIHHTRPVRQPWTASKKVPGLRQ